MKSTAAPCAPKPIAYPILMRYIGPTENSGVFIVLFTSPDTGMVVHSTNSSRPVGDHSHDWVGPRKSPDWWEVYNGSITLSND
jgi:hypothetical protein